MNEIIARAAHLLRVHGYRGTADDLLSYDEQQEAALTEARREATLQGEPCAVCDWHPRLPTKTVCTKCDERTAR